MAKHVQVVVPFKGGETEVDAGIAPLLMEVWRVLGPCTLNSCEDDDGRIWIHFQDGTSAERLVNLVALQAVADATPPYGKTLSYRARGMGQSEDGSLIFQRGDAWCFKVWPVDFPTELDEPMVWLTVHLYMPRSDGEAVLDILRSVETGAVAERYGEAVSEIYFVSRLDSAGIAYDLQGRPGDRGTASELDQQPQSEPRL